MNKNLLSLWTQTPIFIEMTIFSDTKQSNCEMACDLCSQLKLLGILIEYETVKELVYLDKLHCHLQIWNFRTTIVKNPMIFKEQQKMTGCLTVSSALNAFRNWTTNLFSYEYKNSIYGYLPCFRLISITSVSEIICRKPSRYVLQVRLKIGDKMYLVAW